MDELSYDAGELLKKSWENREHNCQQEKRL